MESGLERRAAVHAALGDPMRLAIADELMTSDRSPSELARRFGLAPSLLAHHLDVLEDAGLVERFVSAADRRRRYVRLVPEHLPGGDTARAPEGSALFVCTHNSARSQLAAALWTRYTGGAATSAGTEPAVRVHPGAVAAAERAGIDLSEAAPRHLDRAAAADLVVTVCDRAHEDVDADPAWWHWSVPDPVEVGTDDAFDDALRTLTTRITTLTGDPS